MTPHVLVNSVASIIGMIMSFISNNTHKRTKPLSKTEIAKLMCNDSRIVNTVREYCDCVNDDK